MRLRNIAGADDIVLSSPYVIKDYKKYKGKYNSLFKNSNPIHVEIGMGKGSFIIEMAKANPNINFIGIEKYNSVLLKALDKIKDEMPNLKIISMDATQIEDVFIREIDVIYLNFSDPWPKNRHKDRRLTSELFLTKYDNLFKESNTIIMKTDNRKFFEFSIMSFVNHNYKIDEISLNLYEDHIDNNVPTEYETKFHSMGLPIYKIVVKK